jgi:hypothetical protein
MKKTIIAFAAILLGVNSYAQDDKIYLPEAEDWAIGIDATPFLSYFGNFIGGADANTAPSWNFLTNNQTITGEYFVSESMAYRGSLRLGFGSVSGSEMVIDRAQDPGNITYPETAPAMVENSFSNGFSNIGLSGGIEWRKGKGRLQGFYGGELGFAVSSSSASYTYGNELNQNGTFNVDVDPGDDDINGSSITTDAFGNTARITEQKSGLTLGVGVRGFIGAEYFILPKLSIGGEFGWGLAFTTFGTSSVTYESEGINGNGDEVSATFTDESSNGNTFGVDTDNDNSVFGPAGSLRLTFHF